MTERPGVPRDQLMKFLQDWRARIIAKGIQRWSDEEFGQLLALNTIIAYMDMI